MIIRIIMFLYLRYLSSCTILNIATYHCSNGDLVELAVVEEVELVVVEVVDEEAVEVVVVDDGLGVSGHTLVRPTFLLARFHAKLRA